MIHFEPSGNGVITIQLDGASLQDTVNDRKPNRILTDDLKLGWSQTSQAEQTSQNPIIWQVEARWNIADGWEVTAGKGKKKL